MQGAQPREPTGGSWAMACFEAMATRRGSGRKGPSGYPGPEMIRGILLLPLDLHDLISLGAAGRDHLDLGTLFLANKGAGQRRGNRNLALLGIGLGLADDL